MRRQTRLMAILEHLRGRRTGTTAQALADRYGVTLRTIYRDLETLREAAIPIRGERGRGGGYALDRRYSMPPVALHPREAAALLTVGRWATELRLLPFTDTLGSALDKVRGVLTISEQHHLIGLMETLQFVGVPGLPCPPEIRGAVEEAWFRELPLRLQYRDGNGILSVRDVRLLGVILDRQITMLNCFDLDKQARRQFRLDRIEQAAVVRSPEKPISPAQR